MNYLRYKSLINPCKKTLYIYIYIHINPYKSIINHIKKHILSLQNPYKSYINPTKSMKHHRNRPFFRRHCISLAAFTSSCCLNSASRDILRYEGNQYGNHGENHGKNHGKIMWICGKTSKHVGFWKRGDGSKPWYRAVNPKIAGKWMFIPLKMYL